MNERYYLGHPLFEEAFEEIEEIAPVEDINTAVFTSQRYIDFLKGSTEISRKDLQEIYRSNHQMPKLQMVINSGNSTILPEIIQDYSSRLKLKTSTPLTKRLKRRKELPRIPCQKRIQDILLTECAKPDSFFAFKKCKVELLRGKKHPNKAITLCDSPPKQLLHLKQKLVTEVSESRKSRFSSLKRSSEPSRLVSLLESQRNYSDLHTNESKTNNTSTKLSYKSILEDYESAVEYDFPPTKLFKVLKCLDKSSKECEKEIQRDVLNEEKNNFERKFDRTLQNEQMAYRLHLRHLRDYKKARKRGD